MRPKLETAKPPRKGMNPSYDRVRVRHAALGALALGALATGAFAVGVLAVGRLFVKRAKFGRVEIDELVVGRIVRKSD